MDLSNLVVVLSHPNEARNVGSVCRAMANFGVSDLRVVGEKENYDAEVVERLAIHAFPIFHEAKYFTSVKAATSDCIFSAGTTRRQGKKRKGRLYLPEEFAKKVASLISENDETSLTPSKVAVIFGNERTGLTDFELAECTVAVRIPSSKNFPSLNLSHAVSIMLYTLYRTSSKIKRSYTPLTLDEVSDTAECIVKNLQAIGLFKRAGRDEMKNLTENLLARAEISRGESDYVKQLFCKIAALSLKNFQK